MSSSSNFYCLRCYVIYTKTNPSDPVVIFIFPGRVLSYGGFRTSFPKDPPVFVSFFPSPKLFFWSALLWALAAVLFWFFGGAELGAVFGLPPKAADAPPIIGVSV